ncbi:TPA: hypothetical protein DDW35_10980 [Candidatus Sumerlaeota bacterium]|jgi:uncharacterized protein|nr:hypothetical protein [Candidatus Sumerlaeota bacterium]
MSTAPTPDTPSPEQPTTKPTDPRAFKFPGRKLGSSWYHWDGNIETHEFGFNEGPGLYFLLLFIELVLVTLLLGADAWFLLRYSFHDFPLAYLVVVPVFCGPLVTWWMVFFICLLGVRTKSRRLAFMWFSFWLTLQVRYLAWISIPFGISRDRVASSCLSITNAIAAQQLRRLKKVKPLVLLPRCLSAETVRDIKAAAAEWDCPVVVVATNRLAREKVREFRPNAMLAVACERDLVSGLYDFGHKLPILVLANDRPFGPCLKSTVNAERIRQALVAIHAGVGKPAAKPR